MAKKFTYKECEEKFVLPEFERQSDYCVNKKSFVDGLLNIQINIFKVIDLLEERLDFYELNIKERITLFEDPEESTDEIVINNLRLKKLYNKELSYLKNSLNEIENLLPEKPTHAECDYFTCACNFNKTQEALDYINEKLKKTHLMKGTRELFTGLAYSPKVSSYSPSNLYYLKYKCKNLFNVFVDLLNK